MPTNILMPALSPTMTEGTLARWLKHEGDRVAAGDVIAEIETDKATMEVEAVDEGVLGKILVADGTENVAVNAPIAVLFADGESADAAPTDNAAAPAPKSADSAPKPPATAPAQAVAPDAAPAPDAPPAIGPLPVANGHAPSAEGGRVHASPLARRMAAQSGIELAGLRGTGPGGRIVRADIEQALQRPAKAAPAPAFPRVAAAPAPAAPVATAPVATAPVAAAPVVQVPPMGSHRPVPLTQPHTLVPHTSMRRVIARRLSDAKQTVPHFYVAIDIDLDPLLALRRQLNDASPKDAGAYKLSVNDFLIKAAAVTLRRVPGVNAAWTDDGIALFTDVDISVAVSIPDGLITPIIFRADQQGLAAISAQMKDLAARAKAGKLKPAEFQGGTFSISNMGMYGVSAFSAIINPPQAAILAVAAGEPRVVVRDGAPAVATMLTATLSVDHRAVDGALGAEWLSVFKAVCERPLSLML